jgi:hypothetical protein
MIPLEIATAPTVPAEVTAAIAAVSAIASAISAAINLYGTRNFQRQQKNTSIDACVSASAALQAAVHKTLEFKANKGNKVDDIPAAMIWAAYDDAWAKWVALNQTFRVAQRYKNAFKQNAPDQASALLSKLRNDLRDDSWIPGGKGDPRDIRADMDAILTQIQKDSGLAD